MMTYQQYADFVRDKVGLDSIIIENNHIKIEKDNKIIEHDTPEGIYSMDYIEPILRKSVAIFTEAAEIKLWYMVDTHYLVILTTEGYKVYDNKLNSVDTKSNQTMDEINKARDIQEAKRQERIRTRKKIEAIKNEVRSITDTVEFTLVRSGIENVIIKELGIDIANYHLKSIDTEEKLNKLRDMIREIQNRKDKTIILKNKDGKQVEITPYKLDKEVIKSMGIRNSEIDATILMERLEHYSIMHNDVYRIGFITLNDKGIYKTINLENLKTISQDKMKVIRKINRAINKLKTIESLLDDIQFSMISIVVIALVLIKFRNTFPELLLCIILLCIIFILIILPLIAYKIENILDKLLKQVEIKYSSKVKE